MAYLSTRVMLAFSLACLFIMPYCAQDILMPDYTTVGKCEEICRLHPEAVCKLDCLVSKPDGKYTDCINHHYYSDGSIEYHCDWD